MSSARRILFIISKFAPGGAERVLTILAEEWNRRGVQVTVVTLKDAELYFPLSPEIKVRRLGLTGSSPTLLHAVMANGRRIRAVRRVIEEIRPEAVISFMTMTNIVAILAAKGTGVPVYAAERNHPERYEVSWIWKKIRDRVYRRGGHLVVQTEGIADYYRSRGIPVAAVIPNPVDEEFFSINPKEMQRVVPGGTETKSGVILAAGRMNEQKGFDMLLQAFAAAGLGGGWVLRIVGEGKERPRLEALARELDIEDRVQMPGTTRQIADEYGAAEIFVLSSRFEGFPNVLLEAMASGLCCIAFDCPTGPAELVEHGRNGLLAEAGHVEELTAALKLAASDPDLRIRFGREAREAAEEYRPARIIRRWEDLVFA